MNSDAHPAAPPHLPFSVFMQLPARPPARPALLTWRARETQRQLTESLLLGTLRRHRLRWGNPLRAAVCSQR